MAKKVGQATVPASNGTPSKMEAVRKAMAELGSDAMPLRIQQFVKEKFNFDMTVNHVSNCKSEIVRQGAKGKTAASKPATPAKAGGEKATVAADSGGQPAFPVQTTETGVVAKKNGATTPPTTPTTPGSMTKIEAVRQALAAKGKDVTASQMQPWIKEQFNLEISNEHITKYKGKILSDSKGGTKPVVKKPTTAKAAALKPAAPKAATPKPAPPKATPAKAAEPTPVSSSAKAGVARGDVLLEDVQTTRELVDRVGAGPLRALIALFE